MADWFLQALTLNDDGKIESLKKILPGAIEGNCVALLCLENYFAEAKVRNETMDVEEFKQKVVSIADVPFKCEGTEMHHAIEALIFGDGPKQIAYALGVNQSKKAEVIKCFKKVVTFACEKDGECYNQAALMCVDFFLKQLKEIKMSQK